MKRNIFHFKSAFSSSQIVIILLLLYLPSGNLKSQVFGNLIEKNIQSTVLINIGSISGSAILVQDTLLRLHLITAKHVIFNPQNNFLNINSNEAKVHFYAQNFKSDSINHITLNLDKLLQSGMVRKDSLIDIAVITIAQIEKSGAIRYFDGVSRSGRPVNYTPYPIWNETTTSVENLYLGEDVLVVGFPSSLGLRQSPQFDYNKPLLKRGSIASVSDNFQTFVIDCAVYRGNSGGPVFLERKSFDKYSLRLIGIVVEYIPLINPTVTKKDVYIETSSYAVVVPIEYANKLIYSN